MLVDFSPPSLVKAIKRNLFAYCEYLGRSPMAEFHASPELKWMLTGISNNFVNNVLHTQLDPGDADARIEATLDHFRSKDSPQLSWWVEPDSRPVDLAKRLVAHGLTYSPGGLGMAIDLSGFNETISSPADLVIEAVSDETTLKHWIEPFFVGFGGLAGFGGRDERGTSFELFAGLGFELPLRSYLGWLGEKPVGTSQLFLGEGVAGIYCVATLPEARGQGIGGALVLAALRDARALDYRIGILQASPLGEPVYRRLGFQDYGRLSHYVLTVEDIIELL